MFCITCKGGSVLKLGFRRYSLPKQGHKTKQTKPSKQNKTKFTNEGDGPCAMVRSHIACSSSVGTLGCKTTTGPPYPHARRKMRLKRGSFLE